MHLAWQIDDIRQLIFERLEPRDLARLVQTCKAFVDVAADELWKTVNSFSPFLCCLPPDFRTRGLRAEDIKRLDFYAGKVQNLVLESKSVQILIRLPPQFTPKKKQSKNHPEKSWKEFWKEISTLRPTSEFLPNLRRLRISNVVEELLIPLIGISGSTLTQIYIKYIHNRQPESVVLKILDHLQDTPKLEYLFVRDGEPDLVPSKLIQQAPLKHLRLDPRIHAQRHEDFQFKQFPLRCEILQKSTLENLTLGLTREWYAPGIKAVENKYLTALKTLWLNLTTFKPGRCSQACLNMTTHSWTCVRDGFKYDLALEEGTKECGRRSPVLFLEGLDNPELSLLNIKFPLEATGTMFLDVVSAANRSCRLRNLSELALAGGGWFNNCDECGKRPAPKITPAELREALIMLLPMSQLKILRLSVAPNFLDVLDLQLYKSITDGLPALEKLWLGHEEFLADSFIGGTTYYETVPLHHLAAFCSMLPSLVEVSVGTVDGSMLEERPRAEWACLGVKSLTVQYWARIDIGRGVSTDLLQRGLKTYFPNSDLAMRKFEPVPETSVWARPLVFR